jgi:hypothetical protein
LQAVFVTGNFSKSAVFTLDKMGGIFGICEIAEHQPVLPIGEPREYGSVRMWIPWYIRRKVNI